MSKNTESREEQRDREQEPEVPPTSQKPKYIPCKDPRGEPIWPIVTNSTEPRARNSGGKVIMLPRNYFEGGIFQENQPQLFGPHLADHLKLFYKYWHDKYPKKEDRDIANAGLLESVNSALKACKHWLQDEICDAIMIDTEEEEELALAIYWGLSPEVIRIPTGRQAWKRLESFLLHNQYGLAVVKKNEIPSSIIGANANLLIAIQKPNGQGQPGFLCGIMDSKSKDKPQGFEVILNRLEFVQALLTDPAIDLDTAFINELINGSLRLEYECVRPDYNNCSSDSSGESSESSDSDEESSSSDSDEESSSSDSDEESSICVSGDLTTPESLSGSDSNDREDDGAEKFHCPVPRCDHTETSSNRLGDHLMCEHKNNTVPVICYRCKLIEDSPQKLAIHFFKYHGSTKKPSEKKGRYRCPRNGCNRLYLTPKKFHAHMLKKHGLDTHGELPESEEKRDKREKSNNKRDNDKVESNGREGPQENWTSYSLSVLGSLGSQIRKLSPGTQYQYQYLRSLFNRDHYVRFYNSTIRWFNSWFR